MSWRDEVRFIFDRLINRGQAEQDLEEEIRTHIELEIEENLAAGMTPIEARQQAQRKFGNITLAKEQSRAMWGLRSLEMLWQDLRFGQRQLRKHPVFTIIAVLSLALGIGANTAIFSLVNTVLLRPLPVDHPQELFSLFPVTKDDSIQIFSYPSYLDFRDRNQVFSGLFVSRFAPISLSHDGNNERLWSYIVSGNYFDVLGIKPALGRFFLPEEDRTKLTHPVTVLSYGCWQRRFGADPTLIGKPITVNGHSFTVIGVAPPGFNGIEIAFTPELWVPVMMQQWIEPGNDWIDRRHAQNLFATGRLKPGISVAQATASLNVLAQQISKEYPDTNEAQSMTLAPPGLIHPILRDPVISFTWALMAIVGLVLLISCTNLANLLLARATQRSKEIAIRLALGASRGRLIRQLLTESVLLSLIGGAIGSVLAFSLVKLVVAIKLPIDFPISISIKLDGRVLIFSLVISLFTGLIFGLVPAWQATRPESVPALKDCSIQQGYRPARLRNFLVVTQVALSLVLLISAGLVLRALQHLQTMSPGFNPEKALMMSVDPGLQGYDRAHRKQFYQQLIERVQTIPGVESVALSDFVPLSLNYSASNIYVEGQPPVRGADVPSAMVATIGVNYFATMGIELVRGRDFTVQDSGDSTPVAIINETFARRFFTGADPVETVVGKRISYKGIDGPFIQIVGVAKDGKYFSIGEEPRPFIYSPFLQDEPTSAILLARTKSDPQLMIGSIRNEIVQLDKDLPVFDVKTLSEHMGLSLFPARIAAMLLGCFGLLALLLAAIGIYGVISYSVAQRTREIGIRMALGAKPFDVLKMVMRQGMKIASIGFIIGLAGALILTRLVSSLLYGVSATDTVTYIGITLLLAVVVMMACYIPARRATKVDPMLALKYD